MGLDMYLKAKRLVSETTGKGGVVHEKLLQAFGLSKEDLGDEDTSYLELSITVAYWRNANAIHKWFVDNCQGGEDNCQEVYVGRSQVVELNKLCNKVLRNNKLADELLPSQGGFFFGSTYYDDWYFNDLANTVKMLNKILKNPKFSKGWTFHYQASW